jgi:hypothetical protein
LQKSSRRFPFKPPPSIYLAKTSRTDSMLGGGAPASTTTVGVNLRAGAPLDIAPTVIEDWQSRAVVTRNPSIVSFVVSL